MLAGPVTNGGQLQGERAVMSEDFCFQCRLPPGGVSEC
jgi:hypothetical protein